MAFVAGHFGEWVQGQVGAEATLALVTLTCPRAGVRAEMRVSDRFGIDQSRPVLDPERCRRFLASLDLSRDVRVRLHADLPPGGGAGMSTAALVALARAGGADAASIAGACHAIEGATDPLMLDHPDRVLWAPREARVLRPLPPPPAAEIVGGFWGEPCRTDPDDLAFAPVDDLVADWARAPDLAEAARLATLSAERTTELRGPEADPTVQLVRSLGALGMARAHTGPARALIFAPGGAPAGAEAALRQAGYTDVLRFRTGGR